MRNARLDEAQAGIKIARRNINNLRYADNTTFMAECEKELKNLLMKVKEETEKAGLKLNIQKTKIMASGPITSWQIDGKTTETVRLFSWAPKSPWTVTADMKLKDTCSLEEKLWKPREHMKKQRHYFADRGLCSQSYGFSSTHVWMWELDHKEGWAPNSWCFWNVVLEKILESPFLDCKKIKPVSPKGNQSWIFTGRTHAEAEAPILWPPDMKSWLIRKASGKAWRQEEKGMTEDEMVGWHHWVWVWASSSLTWVWASSMRWWRTGKPGMLQSMGSDMTEQLNNNKKCSIKNINFSQKKKSMNKEVKNKYT